MRRLAYLLAAAPLLLAAACSTDDPPVTADDGHATWVIPSGPASEPAIPSNRTSEPPTGGAAAAGGVSRCHTGDLRAGTGGVESNGGVLYVSLVFTNRSAARCTLSGYPTVSWVSAKTGKTVNKPFAPNTGETAGTVVLQPGGQAHATLAYHQPGEVDPAKCKPVTVKGYRVAPPRESTSIFVKGTTEACSSTGINTGKVLAIVAGAQ